MPVCIYLPNLCHLATCSSVSEERQLFSRIYVDERKSDPFSSEDMFGMVETGGEGLSMNSHIGLPLRRTGIGMMDSPVLKPSRNGITTTVELIDLNICISTKLKYLAYS